MPHGVREVASFPCKSFCRRSRCLNPVMTVLHMLQRNILRKEVQMKKIYKQWLHDAALAAELFTGQAHWYAVANDDTAKPKKAEKDRDFGEALRAAD